MAAVRSFVSKWRSTAQFQEYIDALQLSAAPVGDVLLTTSRVGPSNSQTAMFPRKRPSRKARKSLAEARNVMIERGRNVSGLDPAHADASDSESLAEVCIEKTTRSRNDSDLDLAHTRPSMAMSQLKSR